MSTSICWELTCDGLVSHPGGVKDSHREIESDYMHLQERTVLLIFFCFFENKIEIKRNLFLMRAIVFLGPVHMRRDISVGKNISVL